MPDKYQDEIEEILRRSESSAPADPARESGRAAPQGTTRKPDPLRAPAVRTPDAAPSPGSRRHRAGRWPTITPGKLLLAGLVLFLIAALLRWSLVIWVGLGILAVAYLMFFVRPAASGYEKRWRGRALEARGSAWRRLARWLRG